ncbi:hypothetical protein BY996DRAFT_2534543 [Phakopsora pachyrhizi]|nr:hypothetical protein BY996DRAFT_2534543 [Phakopsora pachyrhizi]
MASGVGVNPKCVEDFMTLKLGKKIKYIIYNLSNDNTEVVVSKTSDNQSYDEFLADLPSQSCCYAVYDFESPEEAKIKNKMLYASSKDALRRRLVGIGLEVQGTDLSEVSQEAEYNDFTIVLKAGSLLKWV